MSILIPSFPLSLFPICLLFSFDPSFITAEKRLRDAGGNTTTAKMEPVLCRSPETSATKGLRSDLVWSSKSHEMSDTFVTVERKRLQVRWRGDVKPRKYEFPAEADKSGYTILTGATPES